MEGNTTHNRHALKTCSICGKQEGKNWKRHWERHHEGCQPLELT